MKKYLILISALFCMNAHASSLGNTEDQYEKKLPVVHSSYGQNWSLVVKANKSESDKALALQKEDVVKKVLSESAPLWKDRIKKVSVTLSFYPQAQSYSFSDANPESCHIDISYSNNPKPVLVKNMDDDLYITTLHEISHCYLGKEVFMHPMDWKINFAKGQQEEMDMYLEEQSNKLIVQQQCIAKQNCQEMNKNNGSHGPLPIIVYHETFADTLGSIWWLHIKGSSVIPEIAHLKDYRFEKYQKNPTIAEHVSYESLGNLINQDKQKHVDWKKLDNAQMVQMAILLSQDSFVKYLKNREENE
jgi:hypothetical protein